MKLSSISKLTAASLVAGMAFAVTGTPADAQTIPSRIAVTDNTETNVSQVHDRRYHSGSRYRYRHSRRGHRPSIGFSFGFGLASPSYGYGYAPSYRYGYGPSYRYGSSYGLAAPRYGAMIPGSPAWIRYCSQKYKSFDPASGTYLAYSGVRRTCKVP